MGNKKNPTFVKKGIRVTDHDTKKVTYFKAFHRKTALSAAILPAREEALAKLDKRFTAEIMSVEEVMDLKNIKYIDLTLTDADAEAAAAAAATPNGDQLDLVDSIDEAEAQQDADEGAGQEEQAEQAGEGHGAIFQ